MQMRMHLRVVDHLILDSSRHFVRIPLNAPSPPIITLLRAQMFALHLTYNRLFSHCLTIPQMIVTAKLIYSQLTIIYGIDTVNEVIMECKIKG
jgi:hypothetical protein